MASPPPASAPIISPAEIQILVSRAGLVLNPGQVADLVLAWRQVAGLIGAMNRERRIADDMALVFRLPPPTTTAPAVAKRAAPAKQAKEPPPQVKPAATARSQPAGKAKTPPRLAPAKQSAPKSPAKARRR